MQFAHIKPNEGESRMYVLVTLDPSKKRMCFFYSMSWWSKDSSVDPSVFEDWRMKFESLKNRISKPVVKKSVNRYHIRGKAQIHSRIFVDVLGFVTKDTNPVQSAHIDCDVSVDKKRIEIEVKFKFTELGSIVHQLQQLKVFSDSPDKELVRKRLKFFNCDCVLKPIEVKDVKIDANDNEQPDDICVDESVDTREGHPYAGALKQLQEQRSTVLPAIEE